MVLMVISLVRSGEGKGEGFEDVARYWARVKDGRFALSYLDKQVFSWSVKDVFDKDLFRNKVIFKGETLDPLLVSIAKGDCKSKNKVGMSDVGDDSHADIRQIKRIPVTFTSFGSYLNSFAWPLIEEVHADIFSSLDRCAHANFVKVIQVGKPDAKKPIFGFEVAEPVKDGKSRETYELAERDMGAVWHHHHHWLRFMHCNTL